MGILSAGQVVFMPFPFSDLSHNKLRPSLLLCHVRRGDWIACQITSNPHANPGAIPLAEGDFAVGGLPHLSYICTGKLFTAHDSLMTISAGIVKPNFLNNVRETVIDLIRGKS